MKIAIYSRGIENEQNKDMESFLGELYAQKMEPVFFQDFFNKIYSSLNLTGKYHTFSSAKDLDEDIDCLISLGGDGTLLDTVTMVQDKGIPVLGINYGRLGFLANIGKDELHSAIIALAERTYVTEKRTLIHLDANIPIFDDTPYGLNEFTLQKKDSSSMIKIHTYLNGEFLNTYWADGLIVATPTGSTGYSLSCNGPIVFPESGSFVITPIAPHNLSNRPIVLANESEVTIELVAGRDASANFDMQSLASLLHGDRITVKRSQHHARFLHPKGWSFFDTLRKKLHWNEGA